MLNISNPTGYGESIKYYRDGDCALQLLHINEEFLVGVGHQPAPITSLLFVHTARRFYRSNYSMRTRDAGTIGGASRQGSYQNLFESHNLEEEEVVTRFL